MRTSVQALTLAAAVGSAAMGGTFFAFSAFVMNGLGRLPPEQGVAAMQAINLAAVRPALMTGLFGTAACCAGLGVHAARSWGGRVPALLVAGGVLYLAGTVGVTAARNVPLNDRLAAVGPAGAATIGPAGAAAVWDGYLRDWTRWNHVRTVCALAGSACFTLALVPD